MAPHIRPAQPHDAPAIEAVIVAAFAHAEHTGHNEHLIVQALQQAGALSVSLVAQEAGAIVGHIAASPVALSGGQPHWYGLAPLSVLPARQGAGMGTQLTQALLQALQAMGAAGCVVLGEPGYYGRLGFRAEPTLVLPGVPAHYFQAQAFGGAVPAGTVAYHAAFGV